MRLLAFETSAKAASVALFEDGKLLAEQYQNTGLTHSQTLLVMAQDMLKQCSLTAQDVEASAAKIQARLDEGFFRVRFDRLTDAEKRYCRAMAELQERECSTTRIAAVLQRKATSLASTRDRLVRKGMIYSSRQGVVSFTVPFFGDFLRRKMSLVM